METKCGMTRVHVHATEYINLKKFLQGHFFTPFFKKYLLMRIIFYNKNAFELKTNLSFNAYNKSICPVSVQQMFR